MESLDDVSKLGDTEALHQLVLNDSEVLRFAEEAMFADTPLHIAASAGHISFAMEVMNLMPSFARKLNRSLLSPMHLALLHGHFEFVLRLLDADCDLARVKGKEGRTPLHYAIKYATPEVLANMLLACPKAIEDLTIRRESAFHLAVEENKVETLEVLVGWLQRVCHKDASTWLKELLNSKNDKGCSAMDIALSKNEDDHQLKVIELLGRVNAECSKDLLGILQRKRSELRKKSGSDFCSPTGTPNECLAGYLRTKPHLTERFAASIKRQKMSISEDMRNVLLVVAALIATISFQAMYSPPGGFDQGGIGRLSATGSITGLSEGSSNSSVTLTITELGGGGEGQVAMPDGYYFVYLSFNSIAVCFVVTWIVLLLPDKIYDGRLTYLLGLLLACYLVGMLSISEIKTNAPETLIILLAISIVQVCLVLLYAKGRHQLERLSRLQTVRPYKTEPSQKPYVEEHPKELNVKEHSVSINEP